MLKAADDLIGFLTRYKEFVSQVPSDEEQKAASRSAEVLLGFANRHRHNQGLAFMFPDSKGGKATVQKSRSNKPLADVEALMKELQELPTSEIEKRLSRAELSLLDLSILARRLGLAAKSNDTRSQLIERIAAVGFANRRGYDLLRNDK